MLWFFFRVVRFKVMKEETEVGQWHTLGSDALQAAAAGDSWASKWLVLAQRSAQSAHPLLFNPHWCHLIYTLELQLSRAVNWEHDTRPWSRSESETVLIHCVEGGGMGGWGGFGLQCQDVSFILRSKQLPALCVHLWSLLWLRDLCVPSFSCVLNTGLYRLAWGSRGRGG